MARRRVLPIYPTLSEVHRILEACGHDRDRWLVELLWHTGCRVSEVLQLRAGDLTEFGIRSPNLKQHGPAEKHVFLSPEFLDRLRAYASALRPQDVLIGKLDRPLTPISRVTAWRIVTRAGAKANVLKRAFGREGLRPPSPHKYRHGNAVNQVSQGVPINAVQRQLGHANIANTAIYAELADEHRRQLVAGVKF